MFCLPRKQNSSQSTPAVINVTVQPIASSVIQQVYIRIKHVDAQVNAGANVGSSVKMAVPNILGDIDINKTAFFLCDMQERFRPAIKYFPDILVVSKRLVSEVISFIDGPRERSVLSLINTFNITVIANTTTTNLSRVHTGSLNWII